MKVQQFGAIHALNQLQQYMAKKANMKVFALSATQVST